MREDRHVEVAREHLQLARDLRHLLHAVLDRRARGHQLQVVDDDQPEVRLAASSSRRAFDADLHHRDRAGVVDVDRRLRRACRTRRSSRGQSSTARACRCAAGCDSTFASLHISRCVTSDFDISSVKSATGMFVAHAEVRSHAEPERRLAHARPRGDDDQVARLEAGRDAVDVAEAGRHAGDVRAGLVELRDPLEALLQQRLDVAELGRDAALGELEDDLLGPVDELLRLAGALPAEPRDLAARRGSRPRRVAISRTIRA